MKLYYLIIATVILSIASLFLGVTEISIFDIFHLTADQKQILIVSRFPRMVSILIAGMSMSICGLIMQQLSRNKFVSPTTAGTMDSAKLGIMISLVVFSSATPIQQMLLDFVFGIIISLVVFSSASPIQQMLLAFAFALIGTFLFMQILDRVKFKDPVFIPLIGLMFGNIVGSITTFIGYRNDIIQNISSWMQGDF